MQRAARDAVQRIVRVLPRSLLSAPIIASSAANNSHRVTSNPTFPSALTRAWTSSRSTSNQALVREALRRATQSHCSTHVRTYFRQRGGYTNFDPSSPVQQKAKYKGVWLS